MKFDLALICNHLKAAVIPHTPVDFNIAQKFKLGLSDEELIAGIAAFRTFLYELYDALANSKDRFDVNTSKLDATLPKRFPIIEDLGAILFPLGFHGRLETEPKTELVVYGTDLLEVSKMQKYKHMNKMTNRRKIELFDFLSEMGFYFEDADFSNKVDFSNTDVFYVQYENDDLMLVGLKLMAMAQANIKAKYYRYSTVFMRGDFYPLANTEPKPPIVNFIEYVNTQVAEIKEWLIDLDMLLSQSCKVAGEVRYSLCDGIFTYTSRKTKKIICKIDLRAANSSIIPSANHFENLRNILTELPEEMFNVMRSRNRGCRYCSELNSLHFVQCMHGGEPYKFSHKGEDFELCRFTGLEFTLHDAKVRKALRKWIELELDWR